MKTNELENSSMVIKKVSNNPNFKPGRPKGVKNRTTMIADALLDIGDATIKRLHDGEIMTPLEFFISVYTSATSEEYTMEIKLAAAKEAAKYLHKQQPKSVENTIKSTGSEGFNIRVIPPSVRPDDE